MHLSVAVKNMFWVMLTLALRDTTPRRTRRSPISLTPGWARPLRLGLTGAADTSVPR